METSDKLFYEAPTILVIEVRSEGVICNTSPDAYPVWETENI